MAFPSSLGKAWLLGAGLMASAAVATNHDALSTTPVGAPTAKTTNGTYAGTHLAEWDQDAFLGIPFAQAPVGALRWRPPQSINASFDGVREATQYGASCMQYNAAPALEPLSEDCLTINVVRPAGLAADSDEPLPVLVWIYGGGLLAGSTADPQYNLSGIVATAQAAGRPFVGVSMNYRLGMWGFLATPALVAEGSTNLGLRDQRLALRWVQENIGAFGGDASRVTLWGESAGAQSIAYHMFAHGGRDDGLFRAAILESGGPTGAQVQPLSWYGAAVENLTRAVGCWGAQVSILYSLRPPLPFSGVGRLTTGGRRRTSSGASAPSTPRRCSRRSRQRYGTPCSTATYCRRTRASRWPRGPLCACHS